MRVDPAEPLITDSQVESLKLFSDQEQVELLAIFARGVAEARRRAQYEAPRHDCCAEGWRLFDKGDVTYAEPCPTHKPDWIAPEEREKRSSPEAERKRNIDRAKERFGI